MSCTAAYICPFLMSAASIMFWVGLPYLAINWFGAGPTELGLIGGFSAGAYVVTCLLGRNLSARIQHRHMIGVAGLILALVTVSAGLAWSMWVLWALAAMLGFGHGLFWPTVETYLSVGVGPSELRHRMGWFNFSWSAGDVVGCVLGGFLHYAFRLRAEDAGSASLQAVPFVFSSVLGVAVCVIAFQSFRGASTNHSPRDKHDHKVPRSPARGGAAFLAVFWIMALIANWGASAFRGILQNVFPDLGKGILGYTELEWGLLIAMLPLTRTVMFLYWQRHEGWAYKARYLFAFQALLPLAAIICIFNSSYWVFLLAFAMVGVAMSKTYFSSIYYGLDSDHSHRKRGGIHEATLGSGAALGPPLAGLCAWAARKQGVSNHHRAPYVFAFVFLTLGMILQAVLYFRGRRRSRSSADE